MRKETKSLRDKADLGQSWAGVALLDAGVRDGLFIETPLEQRPPGAVGSPARLRVGSQGEGVKAEASLENWGLSHS